MPAVLWVVCVYTLALAESAHRLWKIGGESVRWCKCVFGAGKPLPRGSGRLELMPPHLMGFLWGGVCVGVIAYVYTGRTPRARGPMVWWLQSRVVECVVHDGWGCWEVPEHVNRVAPSVVAAMVEYPSVVVGCACPGCLYGMVWFRCCCGVVLMSLRVWNLVVSWCWGRVLCCCACVCFLCVGVVNF